MWQRIESNVGVRRVTCDLLLFSAIPAENKLMKLLVQGTAILWPSTRQKGKHMFCSGFHPKYVKVRPKLVSIVQLNITKLVRKVFVLHWTAKKFFVLQIHFLVRFREFVTFLFDFFFSPPLGFTFFLLTLLSAIFPIVLKAS